MTTFKLDPAKLDMWLHQNSAECAGDFIPGVLLDSFTVDCKRGYAAIYEMPLTNWGSCYRIVFAPYKDMASVDKIVSEFMQAEEDYENEYGPIE